MNEQEKRFYKEKEKTFAHYGVKRIEGARYSTCEKQDNLIQTIGILQGYINPKKKTRVILDYDPDFKEALISIIED